MPNWCSVSMDVRCANVQGAEKLFDDLKLRQSIADEEDKGMFIGSDSRYLFFGELDINKENVLITGSVKWCVQSDEFEAMVNFMLERTAVEFVNLQYEELSCGEYGEYTYKADKIIHEFIPYECLVNELPEDGPLQDALDKLMNTKSVVEVVKTYDS